MISLHYQYLRGTSTISDIVADTCNAIWTCLLRKVLEFPREKREWLKIARDFEGMWNFNHCIRAIDGKHILIQVSIFLDQVFL